MNSHTLSSIDEDLKVLGRAVSAMGELTVTQVNAALDVFARHDVAGAQKVIRADDALDIQDAEIERRAVGFIARHSPVADDLRRPIAAMKIAMQLERCGDLAKNIAKRVVGMAAAAPTARAEQVADLGSLVTDRLAAVVNAYRQDDAQAAYTVWLNDTEIDERHAGVLRDIVGGMVSDPASLVDATHLLFIAKNLERIGDHATNIAELVHYQITGTDLADRPKL
jgi:phosphate transport system protein